MAAYASESESVSSDYSSDEQTGLKATKFNLKACPPDIAESGQVSLFFSWMILLIRWDRGWWEALHFKT